MWCSIQKVEGRIMSLITKTVLNMTEVGTLNLEEMINSCLQHLGKGLYDAGRVGDTESLKMYSEAELVVINLNSYEGRSISFNTNCINYEELLLVTDEDKWLSVVANAYMLTEIGYNNRERLVEYKNFIKKLLEEVESPKIDFKIIQLGEQQYYLYIL